MSAVLPARPSSVVRLSSSLAAGALAALCLLLTAGGLVLEAANAAESPPAVRIYPGALVIAVLFPIIGALIASHAPRNPIGWLFIVMGFSESMTAITGAFAAYALITHPGVWPGGEFASWLFGWAWLPGFALIPVLLLLFPTGRPLSPRWNVVVWANLISLSLVVVQYALASWSMRGIALLGSVDTTALLHGTLPDPIANLNTALFVASSVAALVSMVVRFRRSSGIERQQLKWFSYAAALSVVDLIVMILFDTNGGNLASGAQDLIITALQVLALAGIPIATAIAIRRYRLYDIDLIIRRTLIYALLTGLLALFYFGSVILLQLLFHALTGTSSDLAIIISTLAIAALFVPLRNRVQNGIDHRFYRRKYDAAQVLSAFASMVRDEVDLNQLTEKLQTVVEETMQPEHVSVWLVDGRRTTNKY